ncbi:MAG: alpha-hydroxy acid oxidase [Bacteroidota bacterium]
MLSKERRAQLLEKYPSISDLEKKAHKRMPFVSWEYLQSGTGDEDAVPRNREALRAITFTPRFVRGTIQPQFATEILGQSFSVPFGVAPVGLTGLMWPKAECILAEMAKQYDLPYCLSTVATQTPETVGPLVGNRGWFQLYPPKDPEMRDSILNRAQEAGFHTLVITADVPVPSRRERTTRAGMRTPPKITPQFVWQALTHPSWTVQTLQNGLPRLKTVAHYIESKSMKDVTNFIRFDFRGDLDWDYIQACRAVWKGPVLLKGILHPADAQMAVDAGLDGIVVSNHGGRQFDGVVPAIQALPAIVEQIEGKVPIVYDSGVRSGLDILRALALGADFVLLGRAYLYGVAALELEGASLATEILKEDMRNNMIQLGVESIEQLRELIPLSIKVQV